MKNALFTLAAPASIALAVLAALPAHATTINFDDLADGDVLSTQYAGLGVTFSANAFSGANSNSTAVGWATNTDMTIAMASGPNAAALGTASLAGGNLLHGFGGWLAEDGDASFRISFATAVSSFSIDFAGVSGLDAAFTDCAIWLYDGATLLTVVTGSTPAPSGVSQFTLAWAGPSITSVVVTPGSYGDWVGVDNIVFAPVPEPASAALLMLGLAGVGLGWRRRSAG